MDLIDPNVSLPNPCAAMMPAHAGLTDPNDGAGIESADFTALVDALVAAMSDASVGFDDHVRVDPGDCP
jgi:hypothetical protein